MAWVSRVLAVLGFLLVGWALVTAGPAVVHGHPAYPILLVLVVVGSLWALLLHRTQRDPVRGWRRVGSIALALGAVAGLMVVIYARPFTAQEPALAAMESDASVSVSESATRLVLMPTTGASATGVFFQPGAKVEARAYAAVLRPLAEAGHPVVIVKQPLTIAFLALGAFDSAQADFPQIESWVLGGHSLGGTVASIQADGNDEDAQGPARGLLLHASYPGSDISGTLSGQVLSVSGTNDGLATPADIEASRDTLPGGARFEVIEGAVHSFFGDYGPQPGDGEPTISHDEARTQISNASVEFVAQVAGAPVG
jgi:pimeloyl-ACP methyl ester carboxylesterase